MGETEAFYVLLGGVALVFAWHTFHPRGTVSCIVLATAAMFTLVASWALLDGHRDLTARVEALEQSTTADD